MKKAIVILAFLGILAAAQNPAYAASYWSIELNGEIDVTDTSEISFDISFYNDGDAFNAFSFDTDLWFDTTELTPSYEISAADGEAYYDVTYYGGFTASSLYSGFFTQEGYFTISGFSWNGSTISTGTTLIATVTFDVLDPDILNYIVEADVIVLANDPNAVSGKERGFLLTDYATWYLGEASADNPDIVSAVPIPGAGLILLSGLAGLAGIRSRNS